MDWLGLGYYVVICGLLGLAAPWLGRRWVRFLAGAAVGAGAVLLLPMLREMLA